jgi:hypothetical protein
LEPCGIFHVTHGGFPSVRSAPESEGTRCVVSPLATALCYARGAWVPCDMCAPLHLRRQTGTRARQSPRLGLGVSSALLAAPPNLQGRAHRRSPRCCRCRRHRSHRGVLLLNTPSPGGAPVRGHIPRLLWLCPIRRVHTSKITPRHEMTRTRAARTCSRGASEEGENSSSDSSSPCQTQSRGMRTERLPARPGYRGTQHSPPAAALNPLPH